MKGIYKITDKVSNKSYIGQSTNIAHRFKNHIEDIENCDGLRKYHPEIEIENLTFEIIEICKNEKELDERERYWIKYYDTFFNGFNRTMGGKKLCQEEKDLYARGEHPYRKKKKYIYPEIPEKYLRRWMPLSECRQLAEELAVPVEDSNNKGKSMTWNALKEKLSEFGYSYRADRKKIKGRIQVMYYVDKEWEDMELIENGRGKISQ